MIFVTIGSTLEPFNRLLVLLCQLRIAPHRDSAVGNPAHRAAARIGRRAITCLDRREVDKVALDAMDEMAPRLGEPVVMQSGRETVENIARSIGCLGRTGHRGERHFHNVCPQSVRPLAPDLLESHAFAPRAEAGNRGCKQASDPGPRGPTGAKGLVPGPVGLRIKRPTNKAESRRFRPASRPSLSSPSPC